MELFSDIGSVSRPRAPRPPAARRRAAASWSRPGLGLMIWTLLLFLFTMWVLSKVAFPRIQEALDKRAKTDRRVDRGRRARSAGVRASCSPSTARASRRRASRPTTSSPAPARRPRRRSPRRPPEGKEKREELRRRRPQRDIEAETRRSLEQIRKEVADLTVLATEKVTRKSLDRRRPEAPGRGGPRARSTSPALVGRRRAATSDGGDRSRICRGALRRRQGEGQARRDPRAARPVRRRARRRPRDAALPLQPLLLLGGEERGAREGDRRRRARAASTSSSC